jgi:hypothetical protein
VQFVQIPISNGIPAFEPGGSFHNRSTTSD